MECAVVTGVTSHAGKRCWAGALHSRHSEALAHRAYPISFLKAQDEKDRVKGSVSIYLWNHCENVLYMHVESEELGCFATSLIVTEQSLGSYERRFRGNEEMLRAAVGITLDAYESNQPQEGAQSGSCKRRGCTFQDTCVDS